MGLLRFGTIFALSTKNNLYPCTRNKNLMAYTITITSNSPQALAFVEYLKTLSFVEFTETQPKEKAPAKAKAKAGLAKPEPAVSSQKDETFRKKFLKALQETADVRAGKKEAIPFEDFINEI